MEYATDINSSENIEKSRGTKEVPRDALLVLFTLCGKVDGARVVDTCYEAVLRATSIGKIPKSPE